MGEVLHRLSATRLAFYCPGCLNSHVARVVHETPGDSIWAWNGDMETPTFTPSLRVEWGDKKQCHFIVTNGVLNFLGDTTAHQLRGDVPMVAWRESRVIGF